ncbi:hypothetical protein H5410_022254 [Solanum commersonii]|uniref:Reverse transcriptase n=1 Tax=Solanum commersonii TaxID=4109 RepID=A0A9J5ZEX3_SOLCO|nr:hypothetical protein H5410_022254 [Solanum commersonii]
MDITRPYQRRKFTWTNGHVLSSIDRTLINDEWVVKMPPLQVMVMEPLLLDHSPLSIVVETQRDIRKKLFIFYNYLAHHLDLQTKIQLSWQRQNRGMKGVWQNLKSVGKLIIKSLCSPRKISSTIIRDPDIITKEVVSFYKGLLGQITSPMLTIQLAAMRDGPILTKSQQFSLIQSFTVDDVLTTLKGINDNKAPRGDAEEMSNQLSSYMNVFSSSLKYQVVGGLNIIDVYMWNKTTILKHLWNLSKKKDKLWIAWVHNYYIKNRKPWEKQAKQASWIVRKILRAGHWISEAGLQVTEFMEAQTFTIKDIKTKSIEARQAKGDEI